MSEPAQEPKGRLLEVVFAIRGVPTFYQKGVCDLVIETLQLNKDEALSPYLGIIEPLNEVGAVGCEFVLGGNNYSFMGHPPISDEQILLDVTLFSLRLVKLPSCPD